MLIYLVIRLFYTCLYDVNSLKMIPRRWNMSDYQRIICENVHLILVH
jgi:hypothetical protein